MNNNFENHINCIRRYLKKITLIAIVLSVISTTVFILSFELIVSDFNILIFVLLLIVGILPGTTSIFYFKGYIKDLNWILNNYYTEKQKCITLIKKRISRILKRKNYKKFKEVCKYSKSEHLMNLYHLISVYDILNGNEF